MLLITVLSRSHIAHLRRSGIFIDYKLDLPIRAFSTLGKLDCLAQRPIRFYSLLHLLFRNFETKAKDFLPLLRLIEMCTVATFVNLGDLCGSLFELFERLRCAIAPIVCPLV